MKTFKLISTYLQLVSQINNTAKVVGFYEVLLSKVQNAALTVTVGGFFTVGVFGISRHTIVKTYVCCGTLEDKEDNIRIEVGGDPCPVSRL